MRFFALFLALLAISYVRLESTFDLTPDYHVPKTIMFSCSIGGSSHVQWVLSILEELTSRGHRAIFYATVIPELKKGGEETIFINYL